MVRALAIHDRDPTSVPALGVICRQAGFEPLCRAGYEGVQEQDYVICRFSLVVLYSAPRCFCLGAPVFLSPKTKILFVQILLDLSWFNGLPN